LPLDEKQAFTAENQKILLHILAVVHRVGFARPEDVDVDAVLGEVDIALELAVAPGLPRTASPTPYRVQRYLTNSRRRHSLLSALITSTRDVWPARNALKMSRHRSKMSRPRRSRFRFQQSARLGLCISQSCVQKDLSAVD